MNILYLLLLVFALPDSVNIGTQTEKQVNHYIGEIASGNDVTLHSWALHEVATVNCTTLQLVQDKVSGLPEYEDYYTDFSCADLRNDEVPSVALSFWDTKTAALYQKITRGKNKVTREDLKISEDPLIHFLLLMERNPFTYYDPEYLKEALDTWIQIQQNYLDTSSLEYALLLSNIIRTSFAIDKYEVILNNDESLLEHPLLPNSTKKLRILGAIDYTFYLFGNYHNSLELQRNYSLPLAEYSGIQNEIKDIKTRQGAYLFSLGKYEDSKRIYEELYNDSLEYSDQATLFNNLGINYQKLGQTNKYISFQLRALEKEESSYKSMLSIYRNLFIYYTSLKDIQTALTYIEKAKEVALANEDTTELALIDLYLSSFYWASYRDHEKALQYLDSADEVLSPKSNYSKYIDLLVERGNILIKIDSLEKATTTFKEVLELSTSKSNTTNYLEALINLTEINLKQNDIDGATEKLDEIKLYTLDNLDFEILTKYYTVRAGYLYAKDSVRKAIHELRPIITQVIDRTKNNTDSQKGYWTVEDEYLEAFEMMTELLIQGGQNGEALSLLDQFKTINDASLYNSPLVKASKLTEEELAEEKKLNTRLQVLRKKYLNANAEERFQLNIQIQQTSAAREQILSKVNLAKDHELPPTWFLQRSLTSDELLLHFTEIGTRLYVSQLTSEDITIRIYELDTDKLTKFNRIADELAAGPTNLFDLYDLYSFLDLDELPAGIEKISVIPDNVLYRIPLEILPTRKPDSPVSYGSTQYLIEDYHFRYFTSLKEYHGNRRRLKPETKNDFAGFAISNFNNFELSNLPSLPYATEETRQIHSVLTTLKNKELFIEQDATKKVFKEQMRNSRLVHVATHSEVSEQDPLFSTIYLKDTSDNGSAKVEQALYAYELFDTPLNSEFIMLNSCSSGSGKYIQGSGIMGISRALRYAGAKSLALNLWSVNDKVAAEFSTDFYDLLNQGYSKSEAIRQAKINQLQRSNANPHFWGAYMMIGNPSPVTNKSTQNGLLFSLLIGITLLAGYSTYKHKI